MNRSPARTPARASQLLSTLEVAGRLGVNKNTVLRLVAIGELEAIDIALSGKPRLRFREETVAALQERRTYSAGRPA